MFDVGNRLDVTCYKGALCFGHFLSETVLVNMSCSVSLEPPVISCNLM